MEDSFCKLSVKQVWDTYSRLASAVETETSHHYQQMKRASLDLSLHLVYQHLCDGGEISHIFEMRSVVNSLCQEFMNDIIQVTNSEDDDDDPAALQNYLGRGRGWLLLLLISKHGVQGLSVGRDFSNLLVTLLPFCLRFREDTLLPGEIKADMLTSNSSSHFLPPIGNVFSQLEMSYKWQKSSQTRDKAIPKHQQVRNRHTNKPDRKIRKQAHKNQTAESSDQDEGSNHSNEEQAPRIRRNKRLIRRCLMSGSRLQENYSRQDSVIEENEQEIYAMLTEVKKDPKHCCVQDLCSLILNLIQSLCLLDLDQVSLIKVISPSILPHLLHVLTGMFPSATSEADELLASSWKKDDSIFFQRQLLRVVLSLCGVISTQQNGVGVILGHKVTSILLDVAQQVHHFQEIKVQLSMTNQSRPESAKAITVDQEFCLFSEINIGLLMCFDMIFQNLPFNLVYIKNAVELVEDFGQSQGFNFLEYVIKEYDRQQCNKSSESSLIDCIDVDPVKVISCFLNTLKSVKVNYIHSVSCMKRKHQKCYYGSYFDHHHDILGQPVMMMSDTEVDNLTHSTTSLPESSSSSGVCLVASWCSFLLSVLPSIQSKVSQIDVLSTLHLSSMCCCVPLKSIVSCVTSSVSAFSPAIQSYALETLDKIILNPYLGGLDSMNGFGKSGYCSSQFCQNYSNCSHSDTKMAKENDNFPANIDSGFSSRDVSKKSLTQYPEPVSRWSSMEFFRALLFSSNAHLSELTAKHLQVLVIGARPDLKEEIFFRVYLPAFRSFIGIRGKMSQSSSEESEGIQFSMATKVHCLSALPYLLQVDAVLKVFLTKRGLGKICRILEDDGLREPTLKVFEALVLLDENRLKCSDNEPADSDSLKGGMVIKAFIDGLAVKTKGDIDEKSLWPGCCPVSNSSTAGATDESNVCLRNLALMVDMWETCSKLCINSDKFVSHFKDSDSLSIAEDTLMVILKQMYSPNCELRSDTSEDSGQESTGVGRVMPPVGCFMWLSLLKALLIVCSACYKNIGHQKQIEERIWRKLNTAFLGCARLPVCKLKMLFDIILSSAMPKKSSVLDISQSMNLSHMYVKEDHIEDDDVRQMLQNHSDEDLDHHGSTERGYDADTEVMSDEDLKKAGIQDQQVQREYYPAIFRLVVNLLVASQRQGCGHEILPDVLVKLLQTLGSNHVAVLAVCEEGLLHDILKGFWEELVSKTTKESVQKALMSLIQLLAQHRLTAQELQKIVRLLQHPGIPQDLVVSTLLSIVENSRTMPHHSVTFPCRRRKVKDKKKKRSSSTSQRSSELDNRPDLYRTGPSSSFMSPSDIDDAADVVKDIDDSESHLKQEPWQLSAITQEVREGLVWPPGIEGFSVAMWLQISDNAIQTQGHTWSAKMQDFSSSTEDGQLSDTITLRSQSEPLASKNLLHVVSIGNEDELLEIWVNISTRSLLFRITSATVKITGPIQKEAVFKDCLHLEQWHHLVVSYSEEHDKKLSNDDTFPKQEMLKGKVTLTLDGCRTHTLWLQHQMAPSPRKHTLSDTHCLNVCLGHLLDDISETGPVASWSLASFMLFRGCCVEEEESLHLYTLGPSCHTLSKCDSTGMGRSYPPKLSKATVSSGGVAMDTLVGLKDDDLDNLRANLVLTYNAWDADQMGYYSKVGPITEDSAAIINNLGLTSVTTSLLSQQPSNISMEVQGEITPHTNYILEKALEEVGGASAILFLVAKVYEDKDERYSDKELYQSKALQLLFAFVNHSSYISRDYMACSGHQLLTKVLTSSHSCVGYHTLKVLMDASVSESLFRTDMGDVPLVLRRKSEAVVTNMSVIEELLLNWRIWERSDSGVFLLMFRALASLIREDHPLQTFNIKQFQSINILNKVFLMYRERIQDARPSFSTDIGQSVVSICQSMMGSPPDVHLIVSMCDFLLNVHPAASTYINHAKEDFYFTLWWDLPETNAMKKKDYLTQIRRPSQQDIQSCVSESKSSSNTGPDLSDSASNGVTSPEDSQSMEYPNILQTAPSEEDIKTEVGPWRIGMSNALVDTSEAVSDLESHEASYSRPIISITTGDSSSLSSSPTEASDIGLDKVTNNFPVILQESSLHISTFPRQSENEEEGLYAPRSDVQFDVPEADTEESERERGLTALCVGLLQTLSSVLLTMPDSTTQKVFNKVLKPDILIVLAHNSSPQIRTAVLKLLMVYLKRATQTNSDLVDTFLQKMGFLLISAQFYQYPTHPEQIEEVISLINGRPFTFNSRLDLEECLGELSALQQAAIGLFISLLDMTVYDAELCSNSLLLALQLFTKDPIFGSMMLEVGLVETLTNMLTRINRSYRDGDQDSLGEHQRCVDNIQLLLSTIVVREFSASGSLHILRVEEVMELLKYLEDKELQRTGNKSCKQVQMMRAVQLRTMAGILHYIECASQEIKPLWMSRQTSSQTTSVYGASRSRHAFSSPQFSFQGHTLLGYPYLPAFGTNNPSRQISSKFHLSLDLPYEDIHSSDTESHLSYGSMRALSGINRAVSVDQSQSKQGKPGIITSVLETFGRKKRLSVVPITQSDLIDRFKRFMVMAVDLFVLTDKEVVKKEASTRPTLNLFFDPPEVDCLETSQIRRLFEFLYRAYEMTLSQDRMVSRKPRNSVMWGAKDVTRVQIGRLITFLLSPRQEVGNRAYVLSYLHGEVRGFEILRVILNTSSDLGTEMAYYIYDLLTVWEDNLNTQQREDAFKVLNLMKNVGIAITSPMPGRQKNADITFKEEKKVINMKFEKGRKQITKKHLQTMERVLKRNDKLYSQLSTLAMDITQTVTRLQTTERNMFVEHIKRSMTEHIQVKKSWQNIVQNLTHERAIWYCADSYPQSWQLDPTEGPSRIRKKLKRCHLNIKPKFLNKDTAWKLESEAVDPPLIYLFEDDHQISDSAALIYQLYRNEKIQHTWKCKAVSPNNESKGELLIGENSIFFVADEAISDVNYTQVLLGNKDQLSMTWPYEDVKEIRRCWYQLRDIGIEIFLTSGKTCILACYKTKERDDLHKVLSSLELPNLMESEDLNHIQRLWLLGEITNFDYLTYLNKMSGRSFNDLMQYPVFPFILKDYVSSTLNLRDSNAFRNLEKPISVQEKSREEKYKNNYEVLMQEYMHEGHHDISGLKMTPFHYGSHYSNSGTVLHFLIRVPPYTKMFLSYQDDNFDLPDRSFHSVETTWRLASFESTTDVKELIPEFFFLPEFLVNSEGFEFGKRQNGQKVSDVILPPWCNGDPRLMILVHRQALESDYVRQNLHHWINLVFGYQQTGQAAVQAINVFHPATYFGMDIDSVKEPLKRQALRTMVKTYGQMPKQLFKQPHPQQGQPQPGILKQLIGQTGPNLETDFRSAPYVPSVLPSVCGLKWGVYAGSPQLEPPVVVWQEKYETTMASLFALSTGEIIGVGEDSYCVTMNSKPKVSTVNFSTDVTWAAIIDWQQPGGILRIKNDKNRPKTNFLQHSPFEQITCLASVPDCRLLFIGGTGGVITVYQTIHNQAKESHIQVRGSKRMLHGHTDTISSLVISKPFSVLVSSSHDNTCIIWDLNRLCYVRSISTHKSAVKLVAISPQLGDIASVSSHGPGSCLQLHTINAAHVATSVCEDTIHCLAFSAAPEGRSINVIAGGLSSGMVRLWSSWNLAVLRDLQHDSLMAKPVISLAYSCDSQRLCMCTSDGTVTMWESVSTRSSKSISPQFMSFL
ncbi:lysosomal-trafficking regulator-like isoform X2 [Argopecten irradians]|uniref:lysosomal-trafficking regulator-like isoform X2 n=1 Tax=Argopecten irradians TaxID=31199 RepID=UPI003711EF32